MSRSGRSFRTFPTTISAAGNISSNRCAAASASWTTTATVGLTYLSLDQPAQAEKTLRRALALTPENPEALRHLGRALMALDREPEARQFLDKFQKVRPRGTRDPLREAGTIELATLRPAERARREIERLREDARTHPSDPELQLAFASVLLADGRTDEAASEFRELLTRNADIGVWERAGKSLLAARQYALARDFLRRAAAPLDLAIALFFTDGPQAALETIAKAPAGELDGDYLLMKARILDAAGQSAEGADVLREGLRLSAFRPEVARQAACCCCATGKRAKPWNCWIARPDPVPRMRTCC